MRKSRLMKDILAVCFYLFSIGIFGFCMYEQIRCEAEQFVEMPITKPEKAIIRWKEPDVQMDEPEVSVVDQYGQQVVEDDVSWEDIYLLASLIHAEVGSVPDDECLYACGSVVLNRMASEEFPDTLEGVIYQSEPTVQYACTIDGNLDKEPDDRCLEIAEELLHTKSRLPEDVVYQAEFEQGSGVYKRFENVVFCYR